MPFFVGKSKTQGKQQLNYSITKLFCRYGPMGIVNKDLFGQLMKQLECTGLF
jgi:hypothetical protein